MSVSGMFSASCCAFGSPAPAAAVVVLVLDPDVEVRLRRLLVVVEESFFGPPIVEVSRPLGFF